jgi:hypothetical protein
MSEYVYGTDGHEGHWLTGEEIVRCKDCKHASMSINGEYAKYCKVLTTLDELGYPESEPQFDADFYCAFGERKE